MSVALCGPLFLTCSLYAAEPLYLVRAGKPVATVVHPALPKEAHDKQGRETAGSRRRRYEIERPARDLIARLRKITGAALNMVQDGGEVGGPAIHVGRTGFVQEQNLGLDKMDLDGFVIKRIGDAVVLAGRKPLGTRQAVRFFLRLTCGYHKYLPGPIGEVFEKSKDLVVGKLDLTVEPDYKSRYMTGIGEGAGVPDGYDWARWLGLHRRYPAKHNIGNVIDPYKYGPEKSKEGKPNPDYHPEYFPLIGGKRRVPSLGGKPYKVRLYDWQPCWSNSEVLRLAIESAKKFFTENPGAECFSLAQNDNYGWCQCAECTKMNGGIKYDKMGHRNYSPIHFRFINQVCEALEKEFPDKKISVYAYQCGTIEPPPFKLHPKVVVQMVNDHSRWHSDQAWRQKEIDFIKRWRTVATTLGFHEHHQPWGIAPCLKLKSTAEFLRDCHAMGVRSYHGEEYPHWALTCPQVYVTARLLWDLDQDPMDLLREYCVSSFGKEAAEPMFRYYSLMEDAWNKQAVDPNAGRVRHPLKSRASLALYSPGLMAELIDCLAKARAEITDPQALQRLANIESCMRLVAMYIAREGAYNQLEPPTEAATSPLLFASAVGQLNAMNHQTLAIRRYMRAKIFDNMLGYFYGLWPKRHAYGGGVMKPQFVPMDPYYCEYGSELAVALVKAAKDESKGKNISQKEFTDKLHTRFNELAKLLTDPASEYEKAPGEKDKLKSGFLTTKALLAKSYPDPAKEFEGEAGAAWKEMSKRIRDYLDGSAIVKRLDSPPKIDGKLDEACWRTLSQLPITHPAYRKRPRQEFLDFPAVVRVGYDNQALYISYQCVEEDLNGTVVRHKQPDSAVWDDDSADLVILPSGMSKALFRHYIVNADGVVFDAEGKALDGVAWKSGMKVAAGRDPKAKAYVLEMALPWSDFNGKPQPGDVWRAQFSRADCFTLRGRIAQRFSTWAPSAKGFNNADYLGVLLFE